MKSYWVKEKAKSLILTQQLCLLRIQVNLGNEFDPVKFEKVC